MNISGRDFIGCFWRNLVHFVKANLLFWLFCLPIVTIPAAQTALYTVCTDAAMGRSGGIWRTYCDTLREKFGKSLVVGLIYALVFALSALAIWFYHRLGSVAALIPEGIALAAAAVSFAALPYSFTMLGKTELKVGEILKNSFIMLLLEPKTSLVSFAVRFLWVYIQTMLFMNLYALILVVGVSLAVFAGAYFAIYGLLKHVITKRVNLDGVYREVYRK